MKTSLPNILINSTQNKPRVNLISDNVINNTHWAILRNKQQKRLIRC